ncbi:unnamed protein product [Adineta steineri]|uniref:Uncharacterized protein n=1 Tax=Adineta steineri TaxID=433720 RepID=A0A815SEB2_9BILA|nr:unnamed protein product [Adineta steineri]CAF4157033.1 unnamed protein product [Adineta steineri]
MACQLFILLILISLAQFGISNLINSSNLKRNVKSSHLQDEFNSYVRYFPNLSIDGPEGWYQMNNEEIRSLLPNINDSMWYDNPKFQEKPDAIPPKILLPLFGFKKFPEKLQNGERNPNIIALVTSIQYKQRNITCDSQSHKITLREDGLWIKFIYGFFCGVLSSFYERFLFTKMNAIGYEIEYYQVPKMSTYYELDIKTIYSDNIVKEPLNKFVNNWKAQN